MRQKKTIDKLPEKYKELWWKVYGDVYDETGRVSVAVAQAWAVVESEMGQTYKRRKQ